MVFLFLAHGINLTPYSHILVRFRQGLSWALAGAVEFGRSTAGRKARNDRVDSFQGRNEEIEAMFPTLLLLAGSLIALSAGLISGRAKADTYDSPLLQKENWLGYSLLSVGLAVAAWYRFLQFTRLYEIEQNHHFGLDYFGIDWNRPIPLIYGALAFVVACYVVWRRRSKSAWHEEKRRLLNEVVILTLLIVFVTFGCFVWPTPWTYETMSQSMIDAEAGTLPGPLEYRGQPVTHFRYNRFTKETEAKMGEKWEYVPDRM